MDVLKKEDLISYVNEDYFKSHDNIVIHIEMDEMWGFYHDKKHQIWLWWAIDHNSGEIVAFWFGIREHKNLDELKKLLAPLNIGTVFADGNYIDGKKDVHAHSPIPSQPSRMGV